VHRGTPLRIALGKTEAKLSMRLMFLTNVAVAALAALCFRVGAQDSGPKLDQKKQPAQAATSQKNATPVRAGRSAAEPMNSSVARPEMKSRGAAKQGARLHQARMSPAGPP
jgi:hypothetical protein